MSGLQDIERVGRRYRGEIQPETGVHRRVARQQRRADTRGEMRSMRIVHVDPLQTIVLFVRSASD